MPFAAALSTRPETKLALEEVCHRASSQIEGQAQLGMLFFSPHHAEEAETLAELARKTLGVECLLGCSGESIVGNEREIEESPALSLWLGRWTQPIQIDPFHLVLEQTSDGYSLLGWPDSLADADPAQSAILMLGDPFSFPADGCLNQLNEDYPNLPAMGGMASGGKAAGECRLILNDKLLTEGGAAGVLLRGPLRMRSIVSQGCRPIGHPYVITKSQDNIILELGGKAPLVQLQQLWATLGPQDQKLFQQGLHIGCVINEYKDVFQRGDFLVRNVLGLDRESGALAITDRIRVGQTVQFHVRDADSAAEDLHALLQMDRNSRQASPTGALLFTCNGRGTRLFQKPNHDAAAIRTESGLVPIAGFFAQGEIGPIGGKNFIHGFTASVVLFDD